MQELAWLIANDLDLEGAKLNQFFRVPFLELQYVGLPAKLRDNIDQKVNIMIFTVVSVKIV